MRKSPRFLAFRRALSGLDSFTRTANCKITWKSLSNNKAIMGDELDISKLLRQKSLQEPPPEYFDKFLRDFRRRQRAELIQRPTWEILWDRLVSLAPSYRV